MRKLFVLVLLSIASPSQATVDDWPALFDVHNVASDDVLNVRTAPNATSGIVGTIKHDAEGVEVIRPDDTGAWGLVNNSENHGWVSLRFLSRHEAPPDARFPEVTRCGGTEPFWSLRREDGQASLDIFLTDRPTVTESVLWETGTANHRHRYAFGTDHMMGVLSRQYCDDGMSDREYGFELNLVLPSEQLLLQGCCSIRPLAE